MRGLNGARFQPMPRYYFNTRIGDELISDPDGEVLVDPDRAWEMARAMIRELLKTDGSMVTVKFDKSLAVTAVEAGMGK